MTTATRLLAASVLTLGLAVPAPAVAKAPQTTCATPEQLEAFGRFQRRLAESESLEKAQKRADRRLNRARSALKHAQRIAPDDTELAAATERVEAMDLAIDEARSTTEVAQAFDIAPAASASATCDLSTGETVATVLGFILGILPGVILLLLLC